METPAGIATWVRADRSGDLDSMRGCLAAHVVLVSPLTDAFEFEGPDAVIGVFASAFELLRDIEVVAVTGADDDWVLHGRNTLGGHNLEELQWLHLGPDGLIDRIELYIRPVAAGVALLARLGGPLSRRGALPPLAAPVSRLALPLAAVLGVVERRVLPRLRPSRP